MTGRAASWCLLLLAACAGAKGDQADPQVCGPVKTPAEAVAADGLDGEYTLRLVATAGARRGATAEGRLALLTQDSAYRSHQLPDGSTDSTYSFPQYGTARMDFSAVGAVVPGDPGSADPSSPGVLVIQRPGRVMLRVGSEANRRGMRRFDGAFTVLQVQQVTDGGFAGTWRSGVGTQESSGHFCAVRGS
jgi:hypothetical protein